MGQNRFLRYLAIVSAAVCLSGCVSEPQKTEKLRDLEYTVLEREEVPEEFLSVIEKSKGKAFRMTYADKGFFYIGEGYGAREKTGYSVLAEEVFETENTVRFRTKLLGPEKGEETKEMTTFPYVVVKLEYVDKDVVFD